MLLVIDGNSLAYRAFYKAPPLTAPDGTPTGVVHLFLTTLLSLQANLKPDRVIVIFDAKGKNRRHELLETYKINRQAMPEDLVPQLEALKEIVPAMGLPLYCISGVEADDVIATLATDPQENVVIVTRDKDLHQLVNDRVRIYDAQNDLMYDREKVVEKFGVLPEQILDLLSLMGDSSDDIPGVVGIGEKSALKLISEFGSLDGVYENLGKVQGKMKEKLALGKDSAYLSREVARLITDVPLPETTPVRDDEALKNLFIRYGLKSLTNRIFGKEGSVAPAVAVAAAPAVAGDASEAAPVLVSEEAESFTVTPLDEGDVTDVQYACVADGEIWVADRNHYERYDETRHILTSLKGTFDAKELYKLTGIATRGVCDALIVNWLRDPDAGVLKAGSGGVGELCAKVIRLADEGLAEPSLKKLYDELEEPVLYLLADMEMKGITIDADKIRVVAQELEKELTAIEQRIVEKVGHPINLNSPKQLGVYLYEELGIPPLKKTKTGYSTAEEVLVELKETYEEHRPVLDDLLRFRELGKLLSTYTANLVAAADRNGRIHTTFKQFGTATGRLSSVNPNLQNIPQRGDVAKSIRSAFVAEEGKVLVSFDYSQIELRILAHLASDAALTGAFRRGADVHTETAANIFHIAEAEVTSDVRRIAKAVNFGIIYGLSAFGLARDTGVKPGEAKTFIERYFARYDGVRSYLDATIEHARTTGWCSTILGRRRIIRDIASRNGTLRQRAERIATNAPIQGSAADIIKLAMIAADRYIRESGIDATLLLQIHDELIFEVAESAAETFMREIQTVMEGVYPDLAVPLTVNGSVGKTWGDLK